MNKFLEICNLPKLNEEEAESLNRSITADEIEAVIKKLLTHKSPGLDSFTGECYTTFKEVLTPSLTDFSKRSKKKEDPQILFLKPASP